MEWPLSFGYHYCCGSDNAVLAVPAELRHDPGLRAEKYRKVIQMIQKRLVGGKKMGKFIISIRSRIKIYGACDK